MLYMLQSIIAPFSMPKHLFLSHVRTSPPSSVHHTAVLNILKLAHILKKKKKTSSDCQTFGL